MMASTSDHWDRVWAEREPVEMSWYQAAPDSSLRMIEAIGLEADAPILDVGGGSSGLALELRRRGYSDLTVADISEAALDKARGTLGGESEGINWVVADVRSHKFGRRFALWHDRAVFHFFVDEADRAGYLDVLDRSLQPGGNVILATFGPQGPTSCSGLPVVRYGPQELAETMRPVARLVSDRLEIHKTPSGNEQQFLFAHLEGR
jgi:ubiquinone/menaquinone biosynthesis C-methylase UbiE